ncbi:MAG: DUF885 family protein, partial [Candidatus Omnitrophica bacterium]|nr:DUF885 family protein [Candidatus Omnitrophota bacterium]
PEFMVPIRASASYSAPITDNPREKAYFYVTTPSGKGAGSAFCDKKTLSSIHKEYMFIVAHETYPGHHLLDSARRDLKNSLRRQIESPLFYEGWASYAERLIDRLGYVKDPAHKLAGLRRQAWRAIRAMLDAGTAISKLKPDAAEGLIRALGYESRVAKSMVSNYMLTPGYQLCYTIGKVEIDRLRDKYSPLMGLKKFHDTLLGGGEIPFEMVNKRMDKACRKNS